MHLKVYNATKAHKLPRKPTLSRKDFPVAFSNMKFTRTVTTAEKVQPIMYS